MRHIRARNWQAENVRGNETCFPLNAALETTRKHFHDTVNFVHILRQQNFGNYISSASRKYSINLILQNNDKRFSPW